MGRPAVLKIDILADAKGVKQGVDDTEKGLGKLGKLGGAAGAAVGAGLAIAGAAVVGLGLASIRAASNAEQSMGAVQSVFGKAASAVEKFADSSAERLGLSENAYRDLAAVVGSQLQSMGKSQQEAAKESDRLISIGADLAATFGGDVSDAVAAVGSLLRGERDPIERYGVAIKDADIKARLAATGQDKLTGAALKTASANATLTLLTEQTKNSLGAFGRESDTLAGKQAVLKAKFDDIKVVIGQALLPLVSDLAGRVLNLVKQFESGTGTGGKLRDAFDDIKKSIQDNRPQIEAVGKALAQVGIFIATEVLPRMIQLYGTELKLLVAGFKLVITVLAEVGKAVLGMVGSFLTGLGSVFTVLGKIPGPFQDNFKQAAAAVGAAKVVVDNLKTSIDKAANPKTAKITADVRGEGDVNSLGAAVNRLKGKTITVTTVQRTVYEAQRDGRGGGLQASAGGLYSMTPSITPADLGGLVTAAAGTSSGDLALLRRTGPVATTIDARTIDARIFVDGALDPDAVARQLEGILRSHAQRLGRQLSYGAL